MNTAKIFTIEFFICIGIISWSNIKKGNVPWPGGIMLAGIGIVIISFSSVIDERLAALLGAGFLMAALMNVLTDVPGATPGTGKATLNQVLDPPPTGTWDVLTFGTAASTTGGSGAPTSGGTSNG